MRADEITAFAKDACDVIELYQGITARQAEKIDALEKQASAAATTAEAKACDIKQSVVTFDAAKLEKAASAVHEAFGQPANYPAEAIAKFWKENPDAMSTTIHKLASKIVAMATPAVEEQEDADLGRVINKKASAEITDTNTISGKNDVAASSFWNNFK